MTKTKDRTAKKATSRDRNAGVSPQSEHYESRETGFYLVKPTASGAQVETPLSNFTASITSEIRSKNDKGDTRVERFVVEARYQEVVSVFQVPAITLDRSLVPARERSIPTKDFDEKLLRLASEVHPLASVLPGKEKHVVAAIKALSSPAVYVKNGDRKPSTPKIKR